MASIEDLRDFDEATLKKLGGVDELASLLGCDVSSGLSQAQAREHRAKFGSNHLPDPELDSFWHYLPEALFEDPTLIILECSAVVQLLFTLFVRYVSNLRQSSLPAVHHRSATVMRAPIWSKQLQFLHVRMIKRHLRRCWTVCLRSCNYRGRHWLNAELSWSTRVCFAESAQARSARSGDP